MLDLGTGTGRLLELLAPLYRRGVGIDMSREMLTVARANLDRAGVHNAQVRQGDIYAPPVERDAFDLVTIHQVLHYLDDPQTAFLKRARLLRPAAAGDRRLRAARLEFLRRGASACRGWAFDRQMADWFAEAGSIWKTRRIRAARLRAEPAHGKLWLGRDRAC
jgi:ArsR family transcriptional regulator